MLKILCFTLLLFLVSCSFEERIFLAEEEIEPSSLSKGELGLQQVVVPLKKNTKPSEKAVSYSFIRNDAKVNLTLIIRQLQLDRKVVSFSSPVVAMLEKEVLPELELNQSQNKDITVGRWNKRMLLLETLWAQHVSEQEKKDLLQAIEGTWSMVGLPKEAKDEELLDSVVVQNLALFFHGVADALAPYKEIIADTKTSPQPVSQTSEEPSKKLDATPTKSQEEQAKPLAAEGSSPKSQVVKKEEEKPISSIPTGPKIEGETKAVISPQIKLEPKIKLEPEIKWTPEPRIFGD